MVGGLISPRFSSLKAKVAILTLCHLKGGDLLHLTERALLKQDRGKLTVIRVFQTGCGGLPGRFLSVQLLGRQWLKLSTDMLCATAAMPPDDETLVVRVS